MKLYITKGIGKGWKIHQKLSTIRGIVTGYKNGSYSVHHLDRLAPDYKIYEIDLDKMLIRDIERGYQDKGLGLSIGNLIDHLIEDHQDMTPKGYLDVIKVGTTTLALDSWHIKIHVGSEKLNVSDVPFPNHSHAFKQNLRFFETNQNLIEKSEKEESENPQIEV